VVLADPPVIPRPALAEPQAVERLRARLALFNPHASIDTAIEGALDPRRLVEADTSPAASAEAATSAARAHSGFIAEAEHGDGISSFILTDKVPLPWDTFTRAMETLIALRGPDLLRCMGLPHAAAC